MSTSLKRGLPLLFAPLFQRLKRYIYHFLSFINQVPNLVSLYNKFIQTFSSTVPGKKKNLILLMKSLTTVFCVQASKPSCEDPSRKKTVQHIQEQ